MMTIDSDPISRLTTAVTMTGQVRKRRAKRPGFRWVWPRLPNADSAILQQYPCRGCL